MQSPQRFVCVPSEEDFTFMTHGSHMDIQNLNLPFLLKHLDDPFFGKWYLQNLCMRIGSVTGGFLTEEDNSLIQFGVKLYWLSKGKGVPRMFFNKHQCSDDCYYCSIYRGNLLMQFGFESTKSLFKEMTALNELANDDVEDDVETEGNDGNDDELDVEEDVETEGNDGNDDELDVENEVETEGNDGNDNDLNDCGCDFCGEHCFCDYDDYGPSDYDGEDDNCEDDFHRYR